MRKILFVWIAILFTSFPGYSQGPEESPETYLAQIERLMEDSTYYEANRRFLKMANRYSVLPDNFCFLFGKNLLYTGYRQKAFGFLKKYLALQGNDGKYSLEAKLILQLADVADYMTDAEIAMEIKKLHEPVEINKENKIPTPHKDTKVDHCNGKPNVICPICKGSGVLIKDAGFGKTYEECPYSDDHGMMKCEHYEEYLKGKLIRVRE